MGIKIEIFIFLQKSWKITQCKMQVLFTQLSLPLNRVVALTLSSPTDMTLYSYPSAELVSGSYNLFIQV